MHTYHKQVQVNLLNAAYSIPLVSKMTLRFLNDNFSDSAKVTHRAYSVLI